MTQTQRDAQGAFDYALAWQDQGGGKPARHCAAVALVALKQFKAGAERLEALAQEMKNPEDETLRVGVLAQAGQAWLLAGDTARAYAVQSAALKFAPHDPELWIDRGQTLATAKNYKDAAADFDQAIKLTLQKGLPARRRTSVARSGSERCETAAGMSSSMKRQGQMIR